MDMNPPPEAVMDGDASLLLRSGRTGFLTSNVGDGRAVSAAVREWALGLEAAKDTVLLGVGQGCEYELLDLLVSREVPVVLFSVQALARNEGLQRKALIEGRLLLYSVLPQYQSQHGEADNPDQIYQFRNRLILANSERVVVGTMRPEGRLSSQLQELGTESRLERVLVPWVTEAE